MIKLEYEIYSKMNMPCPEVKEADEWALYITKKMGYQTYVNPPGGKSFFDVDKYKRNNIKLEFLIPDLQPYYQRNSAFIPNLSIIDVMMFCPLEQILEMMNSDKLERTYED